MRDHADQLADAEGRGYDSVDSMLRDRDAYRQRSYRLPVVEVEDEKTEEEEES